MPDSTPHSAQLDDVLRELAALENPKFRVVNERNGDDHGVNLTQLRAVAKRLKKQQELAIELWETGDTAARLLATLVCRPRSFTPAQIDTMIREIRSPKLLDWFIVNVVKPGKHGEQFRERWADDDGDLVGRAGWTLHGDKVVKAPDDVDVDALLDTIEREMKSAPENKQWAMNSCLAFIGINHPDRRARAVGIGEDLEVLIDYPASPGCTSPYAPAWIAEMVGRQTATA
ncbi:DNA alkylation repair protein [Promicromonospora sp. Populi]|uniref:DNA alkylation repair protein n=1 Tax=Promicromonospora sp. Populi TaxID=3239420 RepID=UPI0034E21671